MFTLQVAEILFLNQLLILVFCLSQTMHCVQEFATPTVDSSKKGYISKLSLFTFFFKYDITIMQIIFMIISLLI